MEILCWEVSKYIVWCGDVECHFTTEEDMINFVNRNKHIVSSVEKVMKGIIGEK